MNLALILAVVAIAGSAAVMFSTMKHGGVASRHTLAGAFAMLNVGALLLVTVLLSSGLVLAITQGVFFLTAVWFSVLEFRLWRDENRRLRGSR